MSARKPLPTSRKADPSTAVARAKANGYVQGSHAQDDKKNGVQKESKENLAQQEAILELYVTWQWYRTGQKWTVEECRGSVLAKGSELPEIHELKDFWRFYISQSNGILGDGPTPTTIRTRAKRLKAGLKRYTETELSNEATTEINHWILKVVPYEKNSRVANIEWPKYNFQPADLDRNLRSLYNRADLNIRHERIRYNCHFIILDFCSSGGRKGHFFKGGRRYKHYNVVLRRTPSGPEFQYSADQRNVKNNKDAEHKGYGYTRREHSKLRYNAPWLLIQFALADGALDADHFRRVLNGTGDGAINWLPHAENLPVCPGVDRQGNVTSEPMSPEVFDRIFVMLFALAYIWSRATMNMMRRAVGKGVDKFYTETERSQHLVQSDTTVFGQSYVARVSSCDGFAAFLGEQPNHDAVDYFQGLEQFWQPGMPVKLPALLRQQVRLSSELVDIEEKMKCCTGDELESLKRDRRNTLARLDKAALRSYREECFKDLQEQRLLHGRMPTDSEPDPLRDAVPERGRLADAMQSDQLFDAKALAQLSQDMQVVLKSSGTVFYRPYESPLHGTCTYCGFNVEKKLLKRDRCKHIHRCRRKDTANKLNVLQSHLRFCYFCFEFYTEDEWERDCQRHISLSFKRCGAFTHRSTLVRPAFCLICKQSTTLSASERLQSWIRDCDAISHIENTHGWQWKCVDCDFTSKDRQSGLHHLMDHHGFVASSYEELDSIAKAEGEASPCQVVKHKSSSPEVDSPPTYNEFEAEPEIDISSGTKEDDEVVPMVDLTATELDELMAEFIRFPSRSPSPFSPSSLSSYPSHSSKSSVGSASAEVKDMAQNLGKRCNPSISDNGIESNSDTAEIIGATGNSTDKLMEPEAHVTIRRKQPIKLKLNPTKTQPRRIILKRSVEDRSLEDPSRRKQRKIIFIKNR